MNYCEKIYVTLPINYNFFTNNNQRSVNIFRNFKYQPIHVLLNLRRFDNCICNIFVTNIHWCKMFVILFLLSYVLRALLTLVTLTKMLCIFSNHVICKFLPLSFNMFVTSCCKSFTSCQLCHNIVQTYILKS